MLHQSREQWYHMRSSARPADKPKRTRRTVRLRRVPVLTAVAHCGVYCDSHRRACVHVRMPRVHVHIGSCATRLFSSLRQCGCVDLLACSHGLCLGSHCRNCMLLHRPTPVFNTQRSHSGHRDHWRASGGACTGRSIVCFTDAQPTAIALARRSHNQRVRGKHGDGRREVCRRGDGRRTYCFLSIRTLFFVQPFWTHR